MKKITTSLVILMFFTFNVPGSFSLRAQDVDMDDIIEVELDYGKENAKMETHVYLNSALWNFEDQYLGNYANVGSSMTGNPLFVNYSGYVSISGYISNTVFAEAEFEMYKGQKGQFKVTRLRGVWSPSEKFRLTLGRDFPAIGVQDKIYYPTSKYRLIAMAPMLYWSVMHATGWWDAGIHLHGAIPVTDNIKVLADLSIVNGPGDEHQSNPDFLTNHMKPNAQGYMYESFHSHARQPWDNNTSKHIAMRAALSPVKNLEFGGSYMFGKYDRNDKYSADYLFGHLLYGGKRLTIAAEYGQLMVQVPDSNFYGPAPGGGFYDANNNVIPNPNALDNKVTQYSWYISAGYKLFMDTKIHYIEPVIRYEVLDSWKEDAMNRGDRQLIWTGLRFSPVEHWVFKAAYLHQTETWKDLKNDGFVIETVFDF